MANPNSAGTAPLNRYSGFTNDGVVITDRRGTKRVGIPDAEEKALGMGSDPLAIYRPAGAKTVSAAKAMGNFTGWTFAAVKAIASEVANIQLRLYQVKGDKHAEVADHALLDLLDGINEQMTGIEFKYAMIAHLELTGITHPRRGQPSRCFPSPT
jgi:phage portal protein BeeE